MVGKDVKFERIRRITGYLVGTVERLMQKRRADYSSKRNAAINEYNKMLKSGKIRKPTSYETALKISKGDPNSPQVQAAKRLLQKINNN